MSNEGTNERKLEDHIAYLKKNGYLKEATEASTMASMNDGLGPDVIRVDSLDDLDIDKL
jgi:stress response protein SCP2